MGARERVGDDDVLVVDDLVAWLDVGVGEGRQGDFQGIAPTGKKIEISGIQIGRFEAGKIVERWGSSDELGIVKQLGGDVTP